MIKVDRIEKKFDKNIAVDNLSFEIKDGEIVGLLGPNGAGKTTTMRILAGYLAADTGSVTIDGIDVLAQPQVAQREIGYMPENNPLYKDMLVSEMLDYAADLKQVVRARKKEDLDFVVRATNIGDVYNRPIRELSKGYKQRVGISVALVNKPKVLILDEPTEGLDPNQRTEIRTLVKKLAREHTIIISTHVMQEVEAVCGRLLIVKNGKLVADGSVNKLLKNAGQGKWLEVELEGRGIEPALSKKWQVEMLSRDGNRIVARIEQKKESIQPQLSKLAAIHKWTMWRVSPQEQHLEELFQSLTT